MQTARRAANLLHSKHKRFSALALVPQLASQALAPAGHVFLGQPGHLQRAKKDNRLGLAAGLVNVAQPGLCCFVAHHLSLHMATDSSS